MPVVHPINPYTLFLSRFPSLRNCVAGSGNTLLERAIVSFVAVIGKPTQKFDELGTSWLVNHKLVTSIQWATNIDVPFLCRVKKTCNKSEFTGLLIQPKHVLP